MGGGIIEALKVSSCIKLYEVNLQKEVTLDIECASGSGLHILLHLYARLCVCNLSTFRLSHDFTLGQCHPALLTRVYTGRSTKLKETEQNTVFFSLQVIRSFYCSKLVNKRVSFFAELSRWNVPSFSFVYIFLLTPRTNEM